MPGDMAWQFLPDDRKLSDYEEEQNHRLQRIENARGQSGSDGRYNGNMSHLR